MMGQCYTCGVVGHPARLCPKGKGKGKDGGFKGKGMSFGGGFGGKGDKGKGNGYKGGKGWYAKGGATEGGALGKGTYGYQGSCWNCGKTGHKSAECRGVRNAQTANVESESGADNVEREVGGYVDLGNVNRVVSIRKNIDLSSPMKIELNPTLYETADDQDWPKASEQDWTQVKPRNNRAAPKAIEPKKSLEIEE